MFLQIQFDKHRTSHYQNHTNLNLKVMEINPGFSLVEKFIKAVNQPIRNRDSAGHSLFRNH